MADPVEILSKIRRPKLLLRAAHHGIADYSRKRELQRILPGRGIPSPTQAVEYLADEERALEEVRISGDATYSVLKHVRVMIALLAEAQLARQAKISPK